MASEGAARRAIRETADQSVDALQEFDKEALQATKEKWANCPHCKHRIRVEQEDWTARLRAVEALLDQGYGKQKADSESGDVTLVVERWWPMSPEDIEEIRAELGDDCVATVEAAQELMPRLNTADLARATRRDEQV
jgi:hypothetical protein